MIGTNPWRQAALAAGRLALVASFAPLAGYGLMRTHGAATGPLLSGGALFGSALVALLVARVASGRDANVGFGPLAGAFGSLLGQSALAVAISMAWAATQRSRNDVEPRRVKIRHEDGVSPHATPKPR